MKEHKMCSPKEKQVYLVINEINQWNTSTDISEIFLFYLFPLINSNNYYLLLLS